VNTFRILFSSSRTWDRQDVIWDALDILAKAAFESGYERVVVVHGACKTGGDMMADAWARDRRRLWPITAERHPADWSAHKRRAGFVRNMAMVHLGADVFLGCIRDMSPGASGCAELAERAGIPVKVIDYDDIADAAEVSS
jgi:hypothetical protein